MKTIFLIIAASLFLYYGNIRAQNFDIRNSQSQDQDQKKKQKQEEEELLEEGQETAKPAKKEESTKTPEQKKQVQKEEEMQDAGTSEEISEAERYYKKEYKAEFDGSFEDVWKSVKKAVADIGCMTEYENFNQTDQGLFKGIFKSAMCVFTKGTDTTYKVLKKFSRIMPLIRGGVWDNGRMQYKFNVKEVSPGKVEIILKGEISGFEKHVTTQVHFWESNGYLEHWMLEAVKKNFQTMKQ